MAMYFLDSSAIVKRYFQEPGHDWIETLHDPNQGHVRSSEQPKPFRLLSYNSVPETSTNGRASSRELEFIDV